LDALLADCQDAAADALLARAGAPAWDEAGFAALTDTLQIGLTGALGEVVRAVADVLEAATDVQMRLSAIKAPGVESSLADVRSQLRELVYPGFVADSGAARLPDLTRYLRAISRRLDSLTREPARDRDWTARVHEMQSAYADTLAELPEGQPVPTELLEVRWMIEELRVSFYAQPLGTRYPISEKRIYRILDDHTV
jgi:ATP-dependent helicase HrpA